VTRRPGSTTRMVDQTGRAKAEGTVFKGDPSRYRRLALAALKSFTRPTEEAMIDAAHVAVWFDGF
jgi:hypothetical protein